MWYTEVLDVRQPSRDHRAGPDAPDEVYDASNDSFPASDPPPWTGVRVGGPPRQSTEPDPAPQTAGDDPPPTVDPVGSPFDGRWVARHWQSVHVSHAEVHIVGSRGEHERSMLRAVVQLGDLTPADVRVTALSAAEESGPGSVEPLRLWSVQSHHNGAVVFEAAAETNAIDDVTELLVTVAPARVRTAGAARASIVQHFTPDGSPADDA